MQYLDVYKRQSLIRAEAKFNGYVVEHIYDYYTKNGTYPPVSELQERLNCFRDLIAYRIVISMPKCHLKNPDDGEREEVRYLYEIANVLKGFLEERGFTAESAGGVKAVSYTHLYESFSLRLPYKPEPLRC